MVAFLDVYMLREQWRGSLIEVEFGFEQVGPVELLQIQGLVQLELARQAEQLVLLVGQQVWQVEVVLAQLGQVEEQVLAQWRWQEQVWVELVEELVQQCDYLQQYQEQCVQKSLEFCFCQIDLA